MKEEGIALSVICNYDTGEAIEIVEDEQFASEYGLFRVDVLQDAIGMLEELYEESLKVFEQELKRGVNNG